MPLCPALSSPRQNQWDIDLFKIIWDCDRFEHNFKNDFVIFFFYLNKKKRLEWIIENGTLYSARVGISPLIETYVIGYLNFIYCLCRAIDIMEQLIFKTENLLNDCLMPSSSADTWSELIHRCISESCQVMEYECRNECRGQENCTANFNSLLDFFGWDPDKGET